MNFGDLTYNDILEYCAEEGIQLDSADLQAFKEAWGDEYDLSTMGSNIAANLLRKRADAKADGNKALAAKYLKQAQNIGKVNQKLGKHPKVNRGLGYAANGAKSFGKSFWDGFKESVDAEYANNLEYFVENGIQLDQDQLENLQEMSAEKVMYGLGKAGNIAGKTARAAIPAGIGAGAALAIYSAAKKRKEKKEQEE